MYQRISRPMAHPDDTYESPFSMPLEELVQELPRAKEESSFASDMGLMLTVMTATWGFLAVLSYLGMFGP